MATENAGDEPNAPHEYLLSVRVIWFIAVGWWATGIWLSIAWILNITIIGLPIGMKMINRVTWIMSLKQRDFVNTAGSAKEQPYTLPIRGAYFVLVGWWASGIWMLIAYFLTSTIIGIPLSIWMYNKLPFVVSLYKY